MIQVRDKSDSSQELRTLFQKIVLQGDGLFMTFLSFRVQKDARHEGKKSSSKDVSGIHRALFHGHQLDAALAKNEMPEEAWINQCTSKPFPKKTSTVYVSLNARDNKKATQAMMLELTKRIWNNEPTGKHTQVKNYMQKFGTRGWNLIDMDAPDGKMDAIEKDSIFLCALMDEHLEEFFWIRTKCGYHCLFHNSKLIKGKHGKIGFHQCLAQCLKNKKLQSIDGSNSRGGVNNDAFTVVPGTFQRGHLVTFETRFCKGLDHYKK